MIRRSTAIVFAVFILLLAGTLIWQRTKTSPEGVEATATTSEDLLIKLDESSLQSITIQNAANRSVKLSREGEDQWTLVFPPAEATDEFAVSTAISQLLNVRITSRPQSIADLQTVGLDPGAYTILLETKEKEQFLINVGNQTPTQGGYYVLTPDRTIYVVSIFGIDGITKFLENPPILITPTPSPESTTEMDLSPEVLTPPAVVTTSP